jgi:hypothetical protein
VSADEIFSGIVLSLATRPQEIDDVRTLRISK